MRKSIWDKRIPTLLGLVILLFGTILTTFFAGTKQLTKVNAVNNDQPQNVRITNITDSAFTVSYTTESQAPGSINYGKDTTLGQNALDDRDQPGGSLNDHEVHSITAKNLQPLTKYFFTITSGQQTYKTDGNDFEVTTGPILDGKSTQTASIEGNVITTEGNPPKEAIIYLTSDNSQVVSAITDENGHYIFSLFQVRTSDLSTFYNFVDNQTVKMLVAGNTQKSNVTLSIPSENAPTITLSKDYDFALSSKVASSSANLSDITLPLEKSSPATKSAAVKIISPQKGQEFSNQQPVFTGRALPDEDIQIVIHSSEKIETVITADSRGNWSYKPSTPLSAGTHTITITTKNSSGILQTITQSFVVFAETVSITPTPQEIIDTPTPTILESSDSAALTVTPTQELPQSGNPTIITVGFIGLIISFMGGLLFLLTRGGI